MTLQTEARGTILPGDDPVMSPRDAAAFLNVSQSWLAKRRCYADGGPAWVKLGPRKVGYRRSALIAFLDKCRQAAA